MAKFRQVAELTTLVDGWKGRTCYPLPISAWRLWDWKPENDRDFTGLPIITTSQNPSQQDQYTQEFRYNHAGEQFNLVLGAFGYYQRIDTQGTEQQGPPSSR